MNYNSTFKKKTKKIANYIKKNYIKDTYDQINNNKLEEDFKIDPGPETALFLP